MFTDNDRPVLGLTVFTAAQVAAACGVKVQIIHRWIERGWIEESIRSATRGTDSLFSFADFFLAGLIARLHEQDVRLPGNAIWQCCEVIRGTHVGEFENPCLIVVDLGRKDYEARIVERAVANRRSQLGNIVCAFDVAKEARLIKKALLKQYRDEFGE